MTFAALYRRQDTRPPCGGGPGWGVARTFPFFAPARGLEVFGPTPLPNPPPQGGRELEGEA
jgi:hypothetical protein